MLAGDFCLLSQVCRLHVCDFSFTAGYVAAAELWTPCGQQLGMAEAVTSGTSKGCGQSFDSSLQI